MKVSKIGEIYKCNICGNIVQVNHVGGGELVCCGQPMQLLKENTFDAAKEKHVPIITKTREKIRVQVGKIEHPMEEKHYIEWIELIADRISYKQFLKPGMKPRAEFCINAKKITARTYCNVHGLWKS